MSSKERAIPSHPTPNPLIIPPYAVNPAIGNSTNSLFDGECTKSNYTHLFGILKRTYWPKSISLLTKIEPRVTLGQISKQFTSRPHITDNFTFTYMLTFDLTAMSLYLQAPSPQRLTIIGPWDNSTQIIDRSWWMKFWLTLQNSWLGSKPQRHIAGIPDFALLPVTIHPPSISVKTHRIMVAITLWSLPYKMVPPNNNKTQKRAAQKSKGKYN